jgi:hypothetical protein
VRRGECIARVFETVREMVQLGRESWLFAPARGPDAGWLL